MAIEPVSDCPVIQHSCGHSQPRNLSDVPVRQRRRRLRFFEQHPCTNCWPYAGGEEPAAVTYRCGHTVLVSLAGDAATRRTYVNTTATQSLCPACSA